MIGTIVTSYGRNDVNAMKRSVHTNEDVCHLVNSRLTKKLIALQAKGYEYDFNLLRNRKLSCLQDDECFAEECLSVTVVDQVYDFITGTYKYLHTVETACGKKGILLIEGIYGFHLKFNTISLSFASALNSLTDEVIYRNPLGSQAYRQRA